MAAAISVFSGLCAAAAAVRFFFLFFTMQYFFFFRCAAPTAAAAPPSLPYAAHSKYKPYRDHSKDRIIKRFHFLFLRLSMRTYAISLLSAQPLPYKNSPRMWYTTNAASHATPHCKSTTASAPLLEFNSRLAAAIAATQGV